MSPQPCIECKRRPKALPRQRCLTCQLRHEPIGEQVKAAAQRRAMVPEPLRAKLTKRMREQAPPGTRWCAGCQSYRDDADFRGEKQTQCYACRSGRAHSTMVEKTYGITAADYAHMLEMQNGRCAICRAKPKSKRLAVDHDHKSGAVRGLLCSRCNHDLLGSAWDSLALATALWHYLNTPPAGGYWLPPEKAPLIGVTDPDAVRPSEAPGGRHALALPSGREIAEAPPERASGGGFVGIPIGSEAVPGKPGVWRYFVEPGGEPPF